MRGCGGAKTGLLARITSLGLPLEGRCEPTRAPRAGLRSSPGGREHRRPPLPGYRALGTVTAVTPLAVPALGGRPFPLREPARRSCLGIPGASRVRLSALKAGGSRAGLTTTGHWLSPRLEEKRQHHRALRLHGVYCVLVRKNEDMAPLTTSLPQCWTRWNCCKRLSLGLISGTAGSKLFVLLVTVTVKLLNIKHNCLFSYSHRVYCVYQCTFMLDSSHI